MDRPATANAGPVGISASWAGAVLALAPGTDWAACLADRPEIGLDELNAEAALLARVDRKYLVPVAALPGLLAGLPGSAQVLEIAGRREFGYESSYFDTPELTSYLLAARRRPRRFKVRVRSYDTGATFSEVKVRDRRGRTVKHRVPGPPTDQAAADLDRAHAAAVLAAAGFADLDVRQLRIQLVTCYRRATVLVGDSRVTIDTVLCATRPDDGSRTELPGLAVVETKSEHRAGLVDRLLWRSGHRPVRFSKYATSLAVLDRTLPASRWSAVIRRTGMVGTQGSS